MSRWSVFYSDAARQDLKNIYEYIAFQLLEKQTAERQVNRIMDVIESLDEMPARFTLYDEEPWHSRGLRKIPVDHFLVFYTAHVKTNTVHIVRIMYGGRDISRHLNETKS